MDWLTLVFNHQRMLNMSAFLLGTTTHQMDWEYNGIYIYIYLIGKPTRV